MASAIAEQALTLVSCPEIFYNDRRAEFERVLQSLLPTDLKRIFLSNSGAESVEAAIKFARLSTGRPNIVATVRAFHGRTMGALSATYEPKYREPFQPLVPGFSHVPYNNLDAMAGAVSDQTAAILIEAVQGEGGVHPGTPEYLRGVREIADARGALLIVDEVQTGFARTGKWFAIEHSGVTPDLLTMGKAIAGGMPMGAVGIRASVKNLAPGTHGSTFGGNPLACAAGLASISEMRRLDLPAQAAEKGAYFMERLEEINAPVIREVRGQRVADRRRAQDQGRASPASAAGRRRAGAAGGDERAALPASGRDHARADRSRGRGDDQGAGRMIHTEITLSSSIGERMFVRQWRPEGAYTRAAVLSHGVFEHSGRYHHVAERFVRHGYAVWALDHVGHGNSGGPRGDIQYPDHFIDDVRLLVDRATAEAGLKPVLLGHSMGGAIAALYAVRHQSTLRALALSSPALKTHASGLLITVGRLAAAVRPTLQAPGGLSQPATHNTEWEAMKASDPLAHNRLTLRLATFIVDAGEEARRRAGELTFRSACSSPARTPTSTSAARRSSSAASGPTSASTTQTPVSITRSSTNLSASGRWATWRPG